MSDKKIAIFQGKQIRRQWDNEKELWYFSVVDVVRVLTNSVDALAYWRKLKERLLKEGGNETVTKCHGLKMKAADGKMRVTDVADTEVMLRIIQSIPSPNAEPFKLWLAKVGYERLEETADPELAHLKLLPNPLLLLDEPTAGVAPVLRDGLVQMIKKLSKDHGRTVVIVEHDMGFLFNTWSNELLFWSMDRSILMGSQQKFGGMAVSRRSILVNSV